MAVEARRGTLGMSRDGLAAKARIDPKTIYNLEKNGKWPIARTRGRIESALGWPEGELARIAAAGPGEPEPAPELEDDPELLETLRRVYRGDPGMVREAARALLEAEASGRPSGAGTPPGRRAG